MLKEKKKKKRIKKRKVKEIFKFMGELIRFFLLFWFVLLLVFFS